MITCPECGSDNIKVVHMQTICGKCGTVIDEGKYSGGRIV
jgi:transcription initiation factor TFIIIB Brf1 subunit/transcription initiation factor TFIIB